MSPFAVSVSILVAYIFTLLWIELSRLSQVNKTIANAALSVACAIGIGLTYCSQSSAQEDTLAPAAVVTADVPAGAFAAIPDDATLSVKAFRDEVAKSIVEQSEKSDKLSRGDKRRIARVMKGGWWNESRRERIIDEVSQKLHAAQAIVVLPDGVEAAVDWDGIITFIERLMPLILQLVKLFGG